MNRVVFGVSVLCALDFCFGFLNDTEEKITMSLMENLNIDSLVFVGEENLSSNDFKNFFKLFDKSISYQSLDVFGRYLSDGIFPDVRTMVVLKLEAPFNLIDLFKEFEELGISKSNPISEFKWLAFVNSRNWEKENQLLIPINTQFILAYSLSSTTYKLEEIYKIKDKTFSFDYGFWDLNFGLSITNMTWNQRRRNLKGAALGLIGWIQLGQVGECIFKEHCLYFDFLEHLKASMNFSFKWEKYDDDRLIMGKLQASDFLDTPTVVFMYYSFGTNSIDVTQAISNIRINWYIKDIHDYKSNDYYIQPFEKGIWTSLLLIIAISSLVHLLSSALTRKYIKNDKNTEHVKDVFMVLDSFCNQDWTASEKMTISSKTLVFTVSFAGLFIAGAYSATITSFIALQKPMLPFRNVEEFLKTDYTLIVRKFEKDAIPETSLDPLFRQLSEKVITIYADWSELGEIVSEKVCFNKFAYISMVTLDQDIKNRLGLSCNFYRMNPPLFYNALMGAMKKYHPMKKIVNDEIIRFHESGIRYYLYNKHVKEASNDKKVDYDSVEFEQITQILMFLAGGILTGFIIFIFELIHKYLNSIVFLCKSCALLSRLVLTSNPKHF